MDNDSEVGSWADSRTEVAAWNRIVQTRRPTDMPGGLLVTLLWVFVSSGGFPCSE
jgi:hypothetical protein